MCVIIYTPDKTNRPSKEVLKKCEEQNPHGIGIAFEAADKEMIRVSKAIHMREVNQLMQEVEGGMTIHFRYATAGGETPELCHPFPTTSTAQLWLDFHAEQVLFTNGTWLNWEQSYKVIRNLQGLKKLKGDLSDTRAMAQIVGATGKANWLKDITDKHHAHKRVRSIVQRYGKKPRFFGKWYDRKGIKFSNVRHEEKPVSVSRFLPRYYHSTETQCDPSGLPNKVIGQATEQDILGFPLWEDEDQSKI